MCGRFTLTVHQLGSVIEQLGAFAEPGIVETYRPRYNIAPGATHFLLRHTAASPGRVGDQGGRREVVPAAWGLINHWSTDQSVAFKQINARAETLTQRPAFREAFRRRRCLLPADGFYEWRGTRGAREAMWFHNPDGDLLWFAGLYEGWADPTTGEMRRTFTIVTTDANDVVRDTHDRMPVIVAESDLDQWMIGDEPERLLRPAPAKVLVAQPASPRVNSARHDDAGLLDPDDPLVRKQLSLF